MKYEDKKNITNMVLLATAIEIGNRVIRNLDGKGLKISHEGEELDDSVINQHLASSIVNHLQVI